MEKKIEDYLHYLKGYKNLIYNLSEEGKKKLALKASKRIVNIDTFEIYTSLKEASEKLNINYSYLSGVLNGKRLSNNRRKIKCNLKWL